MGIRYQAIGRTELLAVLHTTCMALTSNEKIATPINLLPRLILLFWKVVRPKPSRTACATLAYRQVFGLWFTLPIGSEVGSCSYTAAYGWILSSTHEVVDEEKSNVADALLKKGYPWRLICQYSILPEKVAGRVDEQARATISFSLMFMESLMP